MSQALRVPEPLMTVEEFLAWPGDGVHHKHQLIDGEPVAMNPGSLKHGRLQARLARLLGNHLAATRPDCEVVIEPGVRPQVDRRHNVRIPDLSVACAMPNVHLLDQPILIAEILSPSNKRETREAVRACLTIPSLVEVLVLHTEDVRAEVLWRGEDGNWPAEADERGPGETLVLESFGFASPLDELYAKLFD